MRYTCFWDMHSGGTRKTDFDMVFVPLPEEKAIKFFNAKFGVDAESDCACNCCGRDFAIHFCENRDEVSEMVEKYNRGRPFKVFTKREISS